MPSPDLDGLLAELEREPDDARLNYLVACAYDGEGLEHEAVPHYVKAIATGLEGDELHNAHLGLGSTYRAIGRYEEALDTFDRGLETFPGAPELLVFRAMTLHNLGRSEEAVSQLLKVLVEHTDDESILRYRRALEFYADRLSETW
ncbi:MAG: tetratricopeptide repeat protein [Acidimicrobiales bacterium]|nr:tetratricopeptide repeat protein [Acidimicrobiales bacterium]